MFFKIISKYDKIIITFKIKEFKKYGKAKSLVAEIQFTDNSILFIKDYLFLDGNRKYSFNWINKEGKLIIRWDNSPHYPYLKTFPHHKHYEGKVLESKEVFLEQVLYFIKNRIEKK